MWQIEPENGLLTVENSQMLTISSRCKETGIGSTWHDDVTFSSGFFVPKAATSGSDSMKGDKVLGLVTVVWRSAAEMKSKWPRWESISQCLWPDSLVRSVNQLIKHASPQSNTSHCALSPMLNKKKRKKRKPNENTTCTSKSHCYSVGLIASTI